MRGMDVNKRFPSSFPIVAEERAESTVQMDNDHCSISSVTPTVVGPTVAKTEWWSTSSSLVHESTVLPSLDDNELLWEEQSAELPLTELTLKPLDSNAIEVESTERLRLLGSFDSADAMVHSSSRVTNCSQVVVCSHKPLASSSQAHLQCSNWKNLRQTLNSKDKPVESDALKELQERRRRNKESMQRARGRQREIMRHLKSTAARLEAEYNEVCDRRNKLISAAPEPLEMSAAAAETALAYAEAIEAAKLLGAENLYLRDTLLECAGWKSRLHHILKTMPYVNDHDQLTDHLAQEMQNSSIDTVERHEAPSIYRFRPLSDDEVKEMILDHQEEVHRTQHRILDGDPELLLDHVQVLGWDIRRRVTGSDLEFVYMKRFANVSAHDLIDKTWQSHSTLKRFQRLRADTRRLDVLQEVNENAMIIGRDVRSQDDRSVFRSVSLQFRMEIDTELRNNDEQGVVLPATGYCIGIHSMRSHSVGAYVLQLGIGEHEQLLSADLTVAIEFLNVTNPSTGQKYVEVRWTGKTNYKSPYHAYRNAADTLSTTLRWELTTVGPALSLISSQQQCEPQLQKQVK